MIKYDELSDIVLCKIGLLREVSNKVSDQSAATFEAKWQAVVGRPGFSERSYEIAQSLSKFIEDVMRPSKGGPSAAHITDLRERLTNWQKEHATDLEYVGRMSASEIIYQAALVGLGVRETPERQLDCLIRRLTSMICDWVTSGQGDQRIDEIRASIRESVENLRNAGGETVSETTGKEATTNPLLLEKESEAPASTDATLTSATGGGAIVGKEQTDTQISMPRTSSFVTDGESGLISESTLASKGNAISRAKRESGDARGIEKNYRDSKLQNQEPQVPEKEVEGSVVKEQPRTQTPSTGENNAPLTPPQTPPPPLPAPPWRYLPPPDEPDWHDEYDVRSAQSSDGRLIVGARVRGKKHKYEGTHCDDWFDFAIAGSWTVFAVADGGGSYKFSRVGARAACTGAVEYLAKALADCSLRPQEKLTPDILEDDAVKHARHSLQEGMKAAWASVKKAFEERADSLRRARLLNPPCRDLALTDLYSTLLVAVHTSVQTAEGSRSFVFGCAAGDGMIAVINREGDCNLLMKPDSGEFSSEVEFFTEKTLTTESLNSRIYPFAGGIRALMLMTDGVADDYFPPEKRMGELYADLVLNGIIPLESNDMEEMASDGAAVSAAREGVNVPADYLVECERLLEKPERVILASAEKLARSLKMDPHMLAKRPRLLSEAMRSCSNAMPGVIEPEERLLIWLDSYYVRGSFDDRTLIVMTGETVK